MIGLWLRWPEISLVWPEMSLIWPEMSLVWPEITVGQKSLYIDAYAYILTCAHSSYKDTTCVFFDSDWL
jgi:hypothetical protein